MKYVFLIILQSMRITLKWLCRWYYGRNHINFLYHTCEFQGQSKMITHILLLTESEKLSLHTYRLALSAELKH